MVNGCVIGYPLRKLIYGGSMRVPTADLPRWRGWA